MNESFIAVSNTYRSIMSIKTLDVCESVIYPGIIVVNVIGIVTNLINIRVFVWQGVTSDTTTCSLFALAISNLLGSVFIIPKALCFYVDKYATISNYIADSCYIWTDMTVAYPHIMFSRITCWIIVYTSVERSLCVLVPLRMKLLSRPKNAILSMFTIYAFYFLFHLPLATNVHIISKQDLANNETLRAVSEETPLGKLFLKINSMLGNTILTTVAMVIIATTTTVMLLGIQSSRKWRNSFAPPKSICSFTNKNASVSSFTSSAYKISSRDVEVIKTVSAVTVIYLMCLGGSHAPGMCIIFLPDMYLNGVNTTIFHLTYTLKYLFDGINSMVNLFFYIRLSSRYKAAFYRVFNINNLTQANIIPNINYKTATHSVIYQG